MSLEGFWDGWVVLRESNVLISKLKFSAKVTTTWKPLNDVIIP